MSIQTAIPAGTEEAGISIIMPCFNTDPEYIKHAIQSVLDQDFDRAPYEIIFIDDASSDPDTVSFVDNLEAADTPVRVLRQTENQGQSAARNLGLGEAQYSNILFLDADDFLETGLGDQGYMHRIYDELEGDLKLDILTCNVMMTGALSGPLPGMEHYSERVMIITNQIPVFSAFRREVALEIGGFDENMRGAEDYDFWIRMLNHHHKEGDGANVKKLPDYLVYYRQHSHGNNVDASHGMSYRQIMEHVTQRAPEIYAHYYPRVEPEDLPDKLERQFKSILRRFPQDGEEGTQMWFDDYLARLKIAPK